jgi:hypothetical protein
MFLFVDSKGKQKQGIRRGSSQSSDHISNAVDISGLISRNNNTNYFDDPDWLGLGLQPKYRVKQSSKPFPKLQQI